MPSPANPFGNQPSKDNPVTASDKPNEDTPDKDDGKLTAVYEKNPEAAKKYLDDNVEFIDWGGKTEPSNAS